MTDLDLIALRLSEIDAPIDGDIGHNMCVLCEADTCCGHSFPGNRKESLGHEPDCPWWLARKWRKAKDEALDKARAELAAAERQAQLARAQVEKLSTEVRIEQKDSDGDPR